VSNGVLSDKTKFITIFVLDKLFLHTVTDSPKAFLGNGSVNNVNVQQWKMCLTGRMLLRDATQERTNEDAD
jgi:hypothetical protein